MKKRREFCRKKFFHSLGEGIRNTAPLHKFLNQNDSSQVLERRNLQQKPKSTNKRQKVATKRQSKLWNRFFCLLSSKKVCRDYHSLHDQSSYLYNHLLNDEFQDKD